MRRGRYSLKTLLWLVLCVACFCGGMVVQREMDRRRWEYVGKNNWSLDGSDPFELSADEEPY